MKLNRIVALSALVVVLWSCNNDDGGATIEPPRPLSEVLVEDETEIQEYLKTHYYNYAEFESPAEDFDFKIEIKEIGEGDTDKTPLVDQVVPIEINVPSTHFLISGEETTTKHTLYYLEAREGVGEALSVADSAFVRYSGNLIDGTVFDDSNENDPLWFDLASLQAPATSTITGTAARGFSEGASLLKGGAPAEINDDGTYSVKGYGVGMIIFPSGLGYFNIARGSIPAYSPLIFKIDMFAVNQADHDGDGIPSIEEDTNQDGYLFNDDADQDGNPDYLDSDTN
ncbi:peptidylprolyl isomerase [Zobellia amurskyensis]|uniref:Peptidyl-prolyl cis-trans isomerase n=1 Tax=Zobellia amurskyensis TaxID=248905 RepID=A0A7X2ZW35_9FLAO|nr:FKBP-type peptidyl-prolyl cis-trans isomerase [Zobellia amurskyensis]MUH37451.1 peptidylprolyl isomerase [Zobellia amurskyensis]